MAMQVRGPPGTYEVTYTTHAEKGPPSRVHDRTAVVGDVERVVPLTPAPTNVAVGVPMKASLKLRACPLTNRRLLNRT